MEDNNLDTEIYGDWFEVKKRIWESWYKLISLVEELVEYKIKNVNPLQSRAYSKSCGALYSVYRYIGISKYKKFLEDKQFDELKNIAEKVIKGKKPNYEEIQNFMDITDFWFEQSGMGKIDKEIDDPSDAVLIDRGKFKK